MAGHGLAPQTTSNLIMATQAITTTLTTHRQKQPITEPQPAGLGGQLTGLGWTCTQTTINLTICHIGTTGTNYPKTINLLLRGLGRQGWVARHGLATQTTLKRAVGQFS